MVVQVTGQSIPLTWIVCTATGAVPVIVTGELAVWIVVGPATAKFLADLSSGTAKYDDWFELYNYGAKIVNLAGLFLTDKLGEKSQFEIPAGYSIPPGGFLLVWADGEPEQNRSTDSALHARFQLSAGGEAIGLFAPDGTEIDSVTFGLQTSDIGEGRCPDGTEAVAPLGRATPAAANECSLPAAPEFEPLVIRGNQFTLTWRVDPGHTCQLESTDSLTLPHWTPAGEPFVSQNSTASVTLDMSAAMRRFFRVRILN